MLYGMATCVKQSPYFVLIIFVCKRKWREWQGKPFHIETKAMYIPYFKQGWMANRVCRFEAFPVQIMGGVCV